MDYTTLQVPERPQPQEETVQVYPNPSNNKVWIVLPQEALAEEVKVYNALGQLVKTVQGTNEINISDLERGVYFVSIVTENKERFMRKIAKN